MPKFKTEFFGYTVLKLIKSDFWQWTNSISLQKDNFETKVLGLKNGRHNESRDTEIDPKFWLS